MQTYSKNNGYAAIAMMVFMTVCAAAAEEPVASQIVEGNLRVQALSPTLVRFETGVDGKFVDGPTHFAVERRWPGAPLEKKDGGYLIAGKHLLRIRDDRVTVVVDGRESPVPVQTIFQWPDSRMPAVAFREDPQLVATPWGATPPPAEELEKMPPELRRSGGWDLRGSSVYVFLDGTGPDGRKEYLRLAGPIPMLPIWAYGLQTCSYHCYTEEAALLAIDTYRALGIPLDAFLLDTNWRLGGSCGYIVDTNYFPDIERFFREARARHVRTGMNDHTSAWYFRPNLPPGGRWDSPLPNGVPDQPPSHLASLEYSWNGLTSLLGKGLDFWWWDWNWPAERGTTYYPPFPADGQFPFQKLSGPGQATMRDSWYQRLYWDVQQRFRPELRPYLWCYHKESVPAHRYGLRWTGDISINDLRGNTAALVNGGVTLHPYIGPDVGGFSGPRTCGKRAYPKQYDRERFAELYPGDWWNDDGGSRKTLRWYQMATFGAQFRAHGNDPRHPWLYGPEACALMREYLRLRYRMLPTIYAVARRAHEDGMPLMRRMDLAFADVAETERQPSQWLFGDDLLVLPFLDINKPAAPVPAELMTTPDGKPGVQADYCTMGDHKAGKVSLTRTEPRCGFTFAKGWPDGLAAPDDDPRTSFVVTFKFRLGPIPASGPYVVGMESRGNPIISLIFDGQPVADMKDDDLDYSARFDPKAAKDKRQERPRKMILQPGKTYDVTVEYKSVPGRGGKTGGPVQGNLVWRPMVHLDRRPGWIPPGDWEDLWTGEIVTGPKTIELSVPAWKVPLFARRGGMILLGPDMQWTQEKAWDPITIEAFPPLQDGETTRELYEDDGLSQKYLANGFSRTPIRLTRQGKKISVGIGAAADAFTGQLDKRGWVVRLRLRPGEKLKSVSVDGKPAEAKILAPRAAKELAPTAHEGIPLPLAGPGDAPPPQAGEVVESTLPPADLRHAREVVLEVKP